MLWMVTKGFACIHMWLIMRSIPEQFHYQQVDLFVVCLLKLRSNCISAIVKSRGGSVGFYPTSKQHQSPFGTGPRSSFSSGLNLPHQSSIDSFHTSIIKVDYKS